MAGTDPQVRTPSGVVSGTYERGVARFRGIPYAQPPVGAQRFAAPQPVTGWDGVREATSFGPPPPQGGALGMGALARNAVGDDWLTVNVWTPDPGRDAGLPVMVWFHGGAYTVGMSSLPEYDGSNLARHGVVLVTFNYRVGWEGFGQIAEAPPNRALLDQIAALRWVHDSIRAFGGDPDRVTVFGQSAGGGSIAALLAMPRAVGLFRRAIIQSAPGTFFAPELADDIATASAAELALRPTSADLASVDPTRLSAAGDAVADKMSQWADRWGPVAHRSIPFSPVVDGDVLPVTPWQALRDGAGRGIDLVVGHTRDEHRLLSALDGMLGQVTPDQATSAVTIFGPGPDSERLYRQGYPTAGPNDLYETVMSDWLFRMPTLRLAEEQITGGGAAHVFELTWPAPGMGGILGACHGLDVPLVFGNLDRGQPAALIGEGPPPEAEALSHRMRTAWTAYAAHGDPGWPAYDAETRLVHVFDSTPAVTAYPEEASRLIWRDHAFDAVSLVDR